MFSEMELAVWVVGPDCLTYINGSVRKLGISCIFLNLKVFFHQSNNASIIIDAFVLLILYNKQLRCGLL